MPQKVISQRRELGHIQNDAFAIFQVDSHLLIIYNKGITVQMYHANLIYLDYKQTTTVGGWRTLM